MPRVNPEILVWARETAGLSLEKAAQKLQFRDTRRATAVDKLTALEAGREVPTRPVLVRMAQQYRRPLLTFYLSQPPERGEMPPLGDARYAGLRTMPRVNPEILVWARETAGLSLEKAAPKLQFRDTRRATAVDKLTALEAGWEAPTRPVLVRMAQQYRRPLLTFYLSQPPERGERGEDFRTLPAGHSAADDALLDALVRDVRARQSMVRAVLEDIEEAIPLDFIGSHRMADGPAAVLASLRTLLDVDLAEYRKQRTPTAAFGLLRASAENAGIFVLVKGNLGSHHTDIVDTDIFRGFAIADDVAPFVIINQHDARSSWSFTLLHELTHLILGQTGVSGARAENDIERFCDDIASEFLLPKEESKGLDFFGSESFEEIIENITQVSDEKKISRTMVAYKAWRGGAIESEMFNRLKSSFRNQWLREREERREQAREGVKRISPRVTRRFQLGPSLVDLVSRAMSSGELTTSKAAKVLGVKPGQVGSLVNAGQPPYEEDYAEPSRCERTD